jgi:hypothetical protein
MKPLPTSTSLFYAVPSVSCEAGTFKVEQPRFCYVIAYGLHNVSQYFKNVVTALIFSLYSCIAMLKNLKLW